MRGAIPGREPWRLSKFTKSGSRKTRKKRFKQVKTHNLKAQRNLEEWGQRKRKKMYGYYTIKISNLKTPKILFDGKMIIIPSSKIPEVVKLEIEYLFTKLSTENVQEDRRGNATCTGGCSQRAGPQTNAFLGCQYPFKLKTPLFLVILTFFLKNSMEIGRKTAPS